jgi:hypothetical protein
MGTVTDDDKMVTRPAAAPARMDRPQGTGADNERVDDDPGPEEGSGVTGLEEAGYGYGV